MQSSPRQPLVRHPSGIECFRLAGSLEGIRVRAEWDGRWVKGSGSLLERAELAMAVDELFAEMAEVGAGAWVDSTPEQMLLALVTCCDEIHAVEYEVQGHVRVIAP